MAEGWIRIDRSLLKHWLWNDRPFSYGQAWIDLLLLANYEDKQMLFRGHLITCKRGDVNLSISCLAERWKWDRKSVRKFLSLLESDGMATTKATRQRTTITLVNYGLFQDVGTTEGTTKRTSKRTTVSHQNGQECPITNNINKETNNTLTSIKAPAAELPLNDGSLYPVNDEDIAEWQKLYPVVDVLQELRKMVGWLNANPTRKKTKSGIKRFINSWLSKEQDKGVRYGRKQADSSGVSTENEGKYNFDPHWLD